MTQSFGYLERIEVRAILMAIPMTSKYPDRDVLLVDTMWQSGARVTEVITLVPERIGITSLVLRNLKQKKSARGEDGKVLRDKHGKSIKVADPDATKEVEVSAVLCTRLRKYCADNGIGQGQYVFRRPDGNHVSRWYVWYMMDRASSAAGIYRFGKKNPRTGGRLKGAFPHHLRHCLSKTTHLITSTGITTPCEDIGVLRGIELPSLVQSCSNVKYIISHPSTLVRLKAGGYEIDCSAAHRVFVFGSHGLDEKCVGDLTTDDYVVGVQKIHWAPTSYIGKAMSRLAGYYTGDGSLGSRTIIFTEKEPSIVDYYKNLLLSFDLTKMKGCGECAVRIGKTRGMNGDSLSYRTSVSSVSLINSLSHVLGEEMGKRSSTRLVPPVFFSAGDGDIKEFIAGFYDAEGFGNKFTSSSRLLIQGIQMLLLKLGIVSSIETRTSGLILEHGHPPKRTSHITDDMPTQTQYDLYVRDSNAFWDTVPTLKSRDVYCERKKILPMQEFMKYLYAHHPKRKTSIKWTKYPSRYIKLAASYPTAEKIIEVGESLGEDMSFWKTVMASDLIPLKVKRVELLPKRYITYDFETAHGNLITNGILSHNSNAMFLLEQTGDISLVKEQLGHARIQTTEIYARAKKPKLRREIAKIEF